MLRPQSKKKKCAGTDENANAAHPPKQRHTNKLKQARKTMRELYICTDMNASITQSLRQGGDTNTTDGNQNHENAPASSTANATTTVANQNENKNTCNMCKNAENTCVNLSNNHCTVVSFSEIIRLPSWSIRQILTSICSRCLVYIGALTESCQNVRLRCEKALQDHNQPLAPPTPDTIPQVATPSPRDLSDVDSPLIVAIPVSPAQTKQHTTREASNFISKSPSPNSYIRNEAMLEIHHESPLSPLTTESGGGANSKGNYQRLPVMPIKLICKFCNREYQIKYYFNKHLRRCGIKFRYTKSLGTGVCSENLLEMANDSASVASEVAYHPITPPPRTYHCNVCPITVDSLTKLRQHKRIHYKRYYCEICAKECTTQVDYDFHRAECTSQMEARKEMDNAIEHAQQMPARRKTRSYSRACSGILCATPAKTTTSLTKEPNTAKRKYALENVQNVKNTRNQSLTKAASRTNKRLQSKHQKKETKAKQATLYKGGSTATQNEQENEDNVTRHIELYTSPKQYFKNSTTKSTTSSRKHHKKGENAQSFGDAESTITNYIQRHKEQYTSSDQHYEEDSTGLTTTLRTHHKEKEKTNQYEEAHSTITNYVQRHKDLYRTSSASGSRFNSTLYSDGEDEDLDDNCEMDSLFSNRLTLTNQWVEIHSSPSASSLSQPKVNTSDCDFSCQTIREYDIYLLERLKREVKQKSVTCFEPKCGFTAFSLNDMMLHDYIDHYKKPRFYCRKCGHWFTSKIFLHYHQDVQDYGRYVCYKCASKFTRQRQLDLHLIQHDKHNAVVRKTKCHHCRFEFLNKEQLLEHCAKEKHNWRRKGMLIKICRAMTIKNKYPLKRRRSTYKSKHSVKFINMQTEPMPSKRCTPMEKYRSHLLRPWISHRIGRVEFDNPWKPNCV